MKTYIKNGRVINPATSQDDIYDVVIDGDRVLQVAKDLEPEAGAEVIDASGKYVMPGFIDLHVHFRDPGLCHAEYEAGCGFRRDAFLHTEEGRGGCSDSCGTIICDHDRSERYRTGGYEGHG